MSIARASGILVHPTSFPGPHGVGDLGESAFRVIDWLHAAGQRYWQIMPLVPVGPGNSPYASISAFAGNPLLISLPWLVGDGLLTHDEIASAGTLDSHRADFPAAAALKTRLLRTAHRRFQERGAPSLRAEFS